MSSRRRNEKSAKKNFNGKTTVLPLEAEFSPKITFNYPESLRCLDKGSIPLKDDLITPVNEEIGNTDHLFWADNFDEQDEENFGSAIRRWD